MREEEVNGNDDSTSVREFSTAEFVNRLDLPPGSLITSVGMIWMDILAGTENNVIRIRYQPGQVPRLRVLPKATLEDRLRQLVRKWHSQANHPIRRNKPEERTLLNKCAEELQRVIAGESAGG